MISLITLVDRDILSQHGIHRGVASLTKKRRIRLKTTGEAPGHSHESIQFVQDLTTELATIFCQNFPRSECEEDFLKYRFGNRNGCLVSQRDEYYVLGEDTDSGQNIYVSQRGSWKRSS